MRSVVVGVLVLLLAGCATLFKGSTQTINFDSNVDGAKVYINGQYKGDTPLQLELVSKEGLYEVKMSKEGYRDGSFTLRANVGVGWIVLDVIGMLIPVVIDAVTGDWYEIQPTYVNVTMEKL